jgi:hypothetical protein
MYSDMHYWPKAAPGGGTVFDTRTATCSIAVNAATLTNGCLWVLPGSHASRGLYPGCLTKATGSRDVAGGVIQLEVLTEDVPRREFLPLAPGDISVRGSHGVTAGNGSPPPITLCRSTRAQIYTRISTQLFIYQPCWPSADPRRMDCTWLRRQRRSDADTRHAHLRIPTCVNGGIRAERWVFALV